MPREGWVFRDQEEIETRISWIESSAKNAKLALRRMSDQKIQEVEIGNDATLRKGITLINIWVAGLTGVVQKKVENTEMNRSLE